MRRTLPLLLLLAGACGSNVSEPRNVAEPAARTPATPRSAAPAGKASPPADPPRAAGVDDMSPGRRRAYERGHRDCRAGRYHPEGYSEAYRIGCAAAQGE